MGMLNWITGKKAPPPPRVKDHRAQFFSQAGGFDGAARDRLTGGWDTRSLSANTIHRMDGTLLRERARDLALNNPLAKSGVQAYIANVIECGILPKPLLDSVDERLTVVDAWNQWGGVNREKVPVSIYSRIRTIGEVMFKKILFILLFISLIFSTAYAENYRLTEDGVQRLSDTAFIPAAIKNADWRDYQKWSKDNTPLPKLPPPVLFVDEKEEKVKARIRKKAIQELISEGELPADYK